MRLNIIIDEGVIFMNEIEKCKHRSPYPPENVSSYYYTDPVYSTDAFYGFEEEGPKDEPGLKAGLNEEAGEPVESWGWINNVD